MGLQGSVISVAHRVASLSSCKGVTAGLNRVVRLRHVVNNGLQRAVASLKGFHFSAVVKLPPEVGRFSIPYVGLGTFHMRSQHYYGGSAIAIGRVTVNGCCGLGHGWFEIGSRRSDVVISQGEGEVTRRRNHEVRVSCMGNDDRCDRPLHSGSVEHNYPRSAIRPSFSASGCGLQGVGRSTMGGGAAGRLDDVLVQGVVEEQQRVGHSCGSLGTPRPVEVSSAF